ncbi:hypothetical protein Ahy_B06g085243 [Arachis hypogaea]|uniref:Plastocyanin-like domain-containing protein n=1 Tax=Arachis hypogaea TaxID=3818 RepID=A0A444YTX6_ARAHY|nr:hypothetical protein Ahy_B06g085243 [Arachis hypogaea]
MLSPSHELLPLSFLFCNIKLCSSAPLAGGATVLLLTFFLSSEPAAPFTFHTNLTSLSLSQSMSCFFSPSHEHLLPLPPPLVSHEPPPPPLSSHLLPSSSSLGGTDQDQGVEKRDIHLKNAHHLPQILVRISNIEKGRHQKTNRKHGSKKSKVKGEAANIVADSISENEISRKEMGLDWMLRPESKGPTVLDTVEKLPEEDPVEEVVGIEGHNPSGHCLVASKLVDSIPPTSVADDKDLNPAKKLAIDKSQPIDITSKKIELSMVASKQCNFIQIPTAIGSLEKLQTLDLSNNDFSGEIPNSLGGLKNLNYLLLDFDKKLPSPDALLINGQRDSAVFTDQAGKTYKFRVSNVGLTTSINFRIQGHSLKLIEVEVYCNGKI